MLISSFSQLRMPLHFPLFLPRLVLFRQRMILSPRPLKQPGKPKTRDIVLDVSLAALAAKRSLTVNLPMADAIIYATARSHQTELITSDAHFAGLPGVTVLQLANPHASLLRREHHIDVRALPA